MTEARLRGRFAPSPTGPLHFGSLVAAVASYLDAKSAGAEWLVRMEDVDTPRSVPCAAESILRSLEAHGMEWDGPVVAQSQRLNLYREALRQLGDRVYPCGCSRRNVAGAYPGTCRAGLATNRRASAFRLRVPADPIEFADRLRGPISESLEQSCGDFVLLRADGIFAYHLAVVVDDIDQDITDIVRGADLLDSTARQVYLYSLLGVDVPRYLHVPVVCSPNGEKLSKQTHAPALDDRLASASLREAFEFLSHPLPPELQAASPRELLQWGIQNWKPSRLSASSATCRDKTPPDKTIKPS